MLEAQDLSMSEGILDRGRFHERMECPGAVVGLPDTTESKTLQVELPSLRHPGAPGDGNATQLRASKREAWYGCCKLPRSTRS